MNLTITPKITTEKPTKERILELVRVAIYTLCFTEIILHLNEYDNKYYATQRDAQLNIALFFFMVILMTVQRVRLLNLQSLIVSVVYLPVAYLSLKPMIGMQDLFPGSVMNMAAIWIALMIITDMAATGRVRKLQDMNLWLVLFYALITGLLMLNRFGRTWPTVYIYFLLVCFIPVKEEEWGRVIGSMLNAGVLSFVAVVFLSLQLNPHFTVEIAQTTDTLDPSPDGRWYGYFLNLGAFGQFLGLEFALAFLSLIRAKDRFGRFGIVYFLSLLWLAAVLFVGNLCGTMDLILGITVFMIMILIFGFKKTKFPALALRMLVMTGLLLLAGYFFVDVVNRVSSTGFDPEQVKELLMKTPLRLFPQVADMIIRKITAFHNLGKVQTDYITNPLLMFLNYIGSSRLAIWDIFTGNFAFKGSAVGGLMYRNYFAYSAHNEYVQIIYEEGILAGGLSILFFLSGWIASIAGYVRSKKEVFFVPMAMLPMMFGMWVGEQSTVCFPLTFISLFVLMPVLMNHLPAKTRNAGQEADSKNKRKKNPSAKGGIGAVVLLSAAVLVLGILLIRKLDANSKKVLKDGEYYVALTGEEEEFVLDNGLYSAKDIKEQKVKGRILITPDRVEAEAKKASWGDRAFLNFNVEGAEEDDLLVLEFTAKSANPTPLLLNINYGGKALEVELDRDKSRYYVPLKGAEGKQSLLMTVDLLEDTTEPICFSNVCVADYGKDCSVTSLKTGEYSPLEFDHQEVEAAKDMPRANSAVGYGNYVYAVLNGELIIYRGASLNEVGRIKDLGETQTLCLSEENKLLAVVSRGSGAYFLDVSRPESPVLESKYSTLEFVYNAEIYDHYAFLCDRYFGIEIVDIADSEKPQYVTRIQYPTDSEYQDCTLYDGYLFAAALSQKRVDIYDVRDLGDIRFITSFDTDGYCMGMAVKDDVLYVATARDSYEKAVYTDNMCYTKGSGCGMEVYGISNPEYPLLLCREKTDGRINTYPQGVWDITIDGSYAYLSMLSGGLYVYDISDPSVPERVSVVNIVAGMDSDLYKEQDPEKILLPYDYSDKTRGNITHTAVSSSGVFCVAPDMGIFKAPIDLKAEGKPEKGTASISGTPKALELPEIPEGYKAEILKTEGNIYALDTLEDGLFVAACGNSGIRVMDRQMHTICSVETGYSVKDVKVAGNLVYSAQSTGGFAVYRYENGLLTEEGRLEDSGYTAYIESLQVTEDGNFVLAQAGHGRYRLIDCMDPSDPAYIKSPAEDGTGTMYYRNLATGLVSGRYLGIIGSSGALWFAPSGTDPQTGKLQVEYVKDESGVKVSEWNGMAPLGDNCIVMTTKGYMIISPEKGVVLGEVESEEMEDLGKCITDGNTVITSEAHTGVIGIYDFSDPKEPVKKLKLDTPYVTDLPCIMEGDIYVPLRHDGIMKITKE